jgi:hypothetical protein
MLGRGAPAIIVFEKQPRWVPELQRQFEAEDVAIIGCRSLRDVRERSQGVERGVILLELTSEPAGCLRFLGQTVDQPGALDVFVVASARTADLEWPVRDLGAKAFFPERIPGEQMASLCRRQWSCGLSL